MCKFFSLISDGQGKIYYFDWAVRKRIIKGELSYESDSHTSIADYYGFKGAKEDKMNRYEYNPLTKVFTIDQINTDNDSALVEKQCNELDFSKIVPALIIKKIVNPFLDIIPKKVGKKEKELLKKYASVRASVRDLVCGSVCDLVRDSVYDLVCDLVCDYLSSFFSIKYKYDFSASVELWNCEFVPSFNGKVWRLHAGKKAEVLFEITAEELRKIK